MTLQQTARRFTGLVMLSVLAGCAPNEQPDRITLSGPFEFTSQDPARDGEVFTKLQVSETLLEIDAQGRLQPGLASDWAVEDSGRRWRLHVRSGVRFHDGTLLDAAAAANSLRVARANSGVLRGAPVEDIVAVGESVVEITLQRPFNPLGAILAHYSTQIVAPASYDAGGFVRTLYGTGPYRIVSSDPPHLVEIMRFDAYWGPPAHIERALYLTGHRAESRALQAMSGQTDVIFTLDPSSVDLLRRQSRVRVDSQAVPRTVQLKLNSGHPFLNDVRARRALSLALDRSRLAEQLLGVPGSEANQLAPPFLADWHVDSLPAAERDLAAASALLAELGWSRGVDGVLQRDGLPFRLQLITYADRPELPEIATAVQAEWRELGIDTEVRIENSSAVPLGHVNGTLQVALVARNYGIIADPLNVFLADFAGANGGEWGAMNWDNRGVIPLLEELTGTSDSGRHRALAQQVSTTLATEMPVIPILFYTQQTAVNTRVANFSFDPFERSFRIAAMELR